MTSARDFITIVSGLPRSGTSLAMRLLDAGGIPALTDGQRTADDNNPKGYFELEAAKRTKADAAWLNDAMGKAVKVITLLIPDLPTDRAYRVLFMRRDLREVVESQAVMLGRMGKKGGGLSPAQLIALYEKQLHAAETYFAKSPSFRVLDVRYADLVAAPGPQVARIDEFLGGGLDRAAMAASVDPSLYRQRAATADAPTVATA
jgi:hypothetical protein